MRWLTHGTLTPAALEALQRHGHASRAPADLSLSPDASPTEVFESATKHQLDLITTDASLPNALYEQHLRFDRTIVLLNVEGGDIEQDDAIDRLFERYKRLSPGRLYTVTGSRVKIRQLPQAN